MAKLYVSEYSRCTYDSTAHTTFPEGPPLAQYVLDTTATHLSATFQAETRFIRLCADGVVSFAIGAAPTATTSNERLPANWIEYIGVVRNSGLKIDCIANT